MHHRFKIGDLDCAVIDAGPVGPIPAEVICANVPRDEAIALLGAPAVVTSLNCMVVRSPGATIVIDTGLGESGQGGIDAFVELLAAENVTAEDVTHVLTTHAHADHVGAHTRDGEPTFPNARYPFSDIEWEHFVERDPDGRPAALLSPLGAAGVIEPLPQGEIVPGLEAVPLPGHTPGHHGFMLSDGAITALFLGDALFFAGGVERPEIFAALDTDGPKAAETRRRMLDRAAEQGTTLIAYHLDWPGTGTVASDGGSRRWVAGLGTGIRRLEDAAGSG